MKKFGWEFQAAWKACEETNGLAIALGIFRRHFGLFGDSESLEKAIFCCRFLHEFVQGLELIEQNFAVHCEYQPFAREAFLFNYELEVGQHLRVRNWQLAQTGLFWLMEDPAVIPEEFKNMVQHDLLEVFANNNDWESFLREYKITDFSGLTSARRNAFKEKRKTAFFRQIDELIRNTEYDKAFELAAEAGRAFPREPEFVRRQAFCLAGSGEVNSAVNLLELHINSKTGWQMHYDLAGLLVRQKSWEKALKHALIAFENPGVLSGKTGLLLLLYRILERQQQDDYGEAILSLYVKLRNNALMTVPADMVKAIDSLRPVFAPMSIRDLHFFLKIQFRGLRSDLESAVGGRFYGKIDFMAEYHDCYAVVSETISNCFCLITDVPANINASGGRIIFRLRENAFRYLDRFDYQAIDVVADTVANRTSLEPERLPFASLTKEPL